MNSVALNSLYVLFASSLRVALKQLVRHKMRTFLTLLGILIGVSSVVAIVSLGEGLRGFFNQSMASAAAADLMYIMPDVPMEPGRIIETTKPFKNRDIEMIRQSQYVKSAIGGNVINGAFVEHDWRNASLTVFAMPNTYFPAENVEIDRGRFYNTAEEKAAAAVCVLGAEVKDEIYEANEEVLGSLVTVNGLRMTVVGVIKSKSAMGGGGQWNKAVMMPLETAQARILGSDDVYWIVTQITNSVDMTAAKEDVAQLLRASRRIRSGADDDFQISAPEDWAEFADNFVNTLIMVFGVVAVIALVVGGIGVMNIMLVSVKERTREIGLRKALGATATAITWQFLVEAMTLTFFGGLLGILAGYGLGTCVSFGLKIAFDVFWTPSVPIAWIIAVLMTCVGIGLAFGVYPAIRAGQLDPIVALRYE